MKIPFSGNVGEFYTVLNRTANGGTGGRGVKRQERLFSSQKDKFIWGD